MRFSPLARGCSSSTSRWEGTIWDEIQHTPRLSASSEAEVKQRSHHVKLASKWRRIGAHLCCDYTGMGPGNMHSLTYMAITVCVFMCIGGVRSAASLMRLQRCVIPQDASIACLSCLVARLETLFLEMLYLHRDMVWNTSCSTYKEQRCPVPALLSDSGEVTTNDRNPPSPYGWKGCEASNIFVPYLALSKVQHHVGIDVLLEAWIRLPLYPMISDILEYWLSTPASGMPLCT